MLMQYMVMQAMKIGNSVANTGLPGLQGLKSP
jgi:hypothetical protein